MRTLMRCLLPALLCVGCGGESEGPVAPGDGDRPPFAGVVSEPVGTTPGDITPDHLVLAPVAWISAPPGANPEATDVAVVNERTHARVGSLVQDGGFDPVAIAAVSGDVLRVEFRRAEAVIAAAKANVPARRRPRVVRTSPSNGQRDVALNASIVIVFTEPVAPSSVTRDNIVLRTGTTMVSGTLSLLSGSAVTYAYTPDEPLAAGTSYELVVSEGVVDLASDPLDGPATIGFSTVATSAPTVAPSAASLAFGYAPHGGEKLVTFSADAPAAAGTFAARTTTIDFAVVSETCSAAWDPLTNSCQIRVRFNPSGIQRSFTGQLELRSAGKVRSAVDLSGTTLDPDLAIVVSGTLPDRFMMGFVSEPVTVTVTNRGPNTSHTLVTRLLNCSFWLDLPCYYPPDLAEQPAPLPISNDTCDGRTLAAAESCTLQIAFAPTRRHDGQYALSINPDDEWLGPGNAAFFFWGTGTGLRFGSGGFAFPRTTIGSSVVRTTVVGNDGDRPTGAIAIRMAAGPVSVVADGDGCSGRQLAPGATCSVSLRYAPTSAGPHTVRLDLEAWPGGTETVVLEGTTW